MSLEGHKNCIIVGGGLCGIFSSILLSDIFENVYIVETAPQCGGLLRSVKDSRGIVYDQGTHVPDPTLVPEIDEILFGNEEEFERNWNNLGHERSGNYYCGQWNLENPIPDVRNLPKKIYDKGVAELLSLKEKSNAKDIVTYLSRTLGPTFTKEMALPIIKKLYDVDDPTRLMKQSPVGYFGITRVIALTPEKTNKLKAESEVFDMKLSYHRRADWDTRIHKEKIPFRNVFYPKKNVGVSFWVDRLIEIAKKKNVHFLNNEYVSKINHKNNKVKSIELGNAAKTINCEYVLWSAPPAFALKAAGIELKSIKPEFRTSKIFHYSFKRPILNDTTHFVWNWDSDFKTFRVTMYPNMQKDLQPSLNNLTVECLANENDEITKGEIHQELIRMKLVDEDNVILSDLQQVIPNTFPPPTFDFHNNVVNTAEKIRASFNNVFLAGRFGGKNWFHRDVIREVYCEIKERF